MFYKIQSFKFKGLLISNFFLFNLRGLDDDPEGHAEMQLEQALDDNDLVYHDNMIAANS